jgi:hypothetical protein
MLNDDELEILSEKIKKIKEIHKNKTPDKEPFLTTKEITFIAERLKSK